MFKKEIKNQNKLNSKILIFKKSCQIAMGKDSKPKTAKGAGKGDKGGDKGGAKGGDKGGKGIFVFLSKILLQTYERTAINKLMEYICQTW